MWAQGAEVEKRSDMKVNGVYKTIKVNSDQVYTTGERGALGIPIELDWGSDDGLIKVEAATFSSDAKKLLGYDASDPKLRNITEAFDGGASTLYLYKLNKGEKAVGQFGTAKCSGTVGNSISIVIEDDPDAGYGDHQLKKTSCTFSGSENQISIDFTALPVGADVDVTLLKDGAEIPKGQFFADTKSNPVVCTLSSDLASGEYSLEVRVNKLLLSTASFTITHMPATEAVMEPQLKDSKQDETVKTGAEDVNVEFSVEGNKVIATYSGITDQTLATQCKMQMGGIMAHVPGRTEIIDQENKTSIIFYSQAAYKGEFTILGRVRTSDGKYVQIASQKFTINKIGENKDAYTDPSYGSDQKEDYSAPVANRFIVTTYLDGIKVDTQKPSVANDLVDNDYVVFNKSAILKATAGDNLTGGTSNAVTGSDWEGARNAFETQSLNIIAVPTNDVTEQKTWVEYTKRLRDRYGILFQIVTPYLEDAPAYNYEGVITYANRLNDEDLSPDEQITNLAYWLGGAEAGCPVQGSCVAKGYNGSYDVAANVTFAEQEWAIDNGILYLHLVDGVPTIGKDINTLTTIEPEYAGRKNEQFKQNQAIRVLDAICIDTADIFNTYFLGRVPNDEIGRSELKTRIIRNREYYAEIRAIDTYDSSNLEINPGELPTDVLCNDAVRLLNVMEYLLFSIEVLS